MDSLDSIVDEIVRNLTSEAEVHFLAVQQAQQQFRSAYSVDEASASSKDIDTEATPAEPIGLHADIVPEAGDSSQSEVPELLSATSRSEFESSNHAKQVLPAAPQALPVAASEPQTTELQQPQSYPGNPGFPGGTLEKIEAPEFVAKNSKLQALKQRRLGSLSSSLDLSRESSFDSASHAAFTEASSSLQNSFAGAATSNSTSALQDGADLNQQASFSLAPMPLDSTTGLEGRRVSLQRRTSSIARKPSTLTDLFPTFDETRSKKRAGTLPAISQPQELSVPLREATAAARTSKEVQQILMQRHHAVVRDQRARQQRREAAERLQHAQLLEALLSESSERRAALEARQAARAAQLQARQDQMAAAAQARREERLQVMGHLAPAPQPVTRKEELEQLLRIENAESELRRLLADHKRMYEAQDQQQEQEQQQQHAALQRAEEARQHQRRREMDKEASTSWGFQTPLERRQAQHNTSLLSGVTSRKAGAAGTLPLLPSKLYDESSAAQHAFRREAQSRRLHDKEFHAKQSIRKRQQEYDQAVKARLAQDAAGNKMFNSSANVAKRAQQQLQSVSDLQAGSSASGSLSTPKAKKLQAFARHPRPPQLPPPPRQLSRIPDDVLLPDISSKGSKHSKYGSDGMASFLAVNDNDLQTDHDGGNIKSQMSKLPKLSSQASSMRRMTQEMPLSSQSISMHRLSQEIQL